MKVLAPFKAAPVAVYAATGVPVLVVAVEQNPGEAYLEGYDVVPEMYLVRVPENPAIGVTDIVSPALARSLVAMRDSNDVTPNARFIRAIERCLPLVDGIRRDPISP